jgi:CheY-like chemotaxis protein
LRRARGDPTLVDVGGDGHVIDVVVIDDEPDGAEALALALRVHGMRVRTFVDGGVALAAIRAAVPHLVVTDLRMDPVDGVTLARALRDDPRTASLPLVALTGHTEPEWAIVRWFDAYLRKPLDVRLAVDVVAQLTAARPPRARRDPDPGG